MKNLINLLIIISLLFFVNNILGQISAIGYTYTEKTTYITEPQDNIFCFTSEPEILLQAMHSTGTANSYRWYQFNSTNKSWDIPLGSSNILAGISEGGYRVVINEGEINQETYQCWVFVPQITGTPIIEIDPFDCGPITAKLTNMAVKELDYYDISQANPGKKTVYYEYSWISTENYIDTLTTIPRAYLEIYYDTNLSASVGGLGLPTIAADPVSIQAKAVKARFRTVDPEKIDKSNEIDPDDADGGRRSAPAEFIFNGSPEKNLRSMGENLTFTWDIGELTSFTGKDSISFEFQEAGDYIVTLNVSNQSCEDSASVTVGITDTKVTVPNVFTPNGDDANDEFRVAYKSVKKFEMTIVNRWGRVVYRSDDPNKGWDGRIGGKLAAPGVYYYDVRWTGFDGTSDDKQGFLHLLTDQR